MSEREENQKIAESLRWAHSLIHRNASRKTVMLGTSRRIESVTREPFKLRMHRSSKLRSRLSSCNVRSSGICGNANRAIRRSIGMPDILVLIIGT